MPLTPPGLEKLLAAKVSNSIRDFPGDTLLGFLDVDEETQNLVLQFMRKHRIGVSIATQLRLWPVTTTYGLSVAAAVGFQNDENVGHGAVYRAWEAAFGWSPKTQPERERLASAFNAAVAAIGLETGTIYPEEQPHYHGGCYLFHGAILPHFVDPLRASLEGLLQTIPLPDEADLERVARFAMQLAEEISHVLPRLKATLRSKVGVFLVRRLVRWHLTEDNTLFPAHIRPLLDQERSRKIIVRAPYVILNTRQGQLELVLPAQNSSIADPQTRWEVQGLRGFRALQDRPPIPLSEFSPNGEAFEVRLSHLHGQLQDLTYTLQAGIPSELGVRVFDAANGKERRVAPDRRGVIELPPNQSYLLLCPKDAEMESDDTASPCGEWKLVTFDPRPGSLPLEIETGANHLTFRPAVRPGVYLNKNEQFTFRCRRTSDGATIAVHYDNSLGVYAAFSPNTAAKVQFATSVDSSLTRSIQLEDAPVVNGLQIVDFSEELGLWLENLPTALHLITVDLESEGQKNKTEELFYWKGLRRLSAFGDFECAELPLNIARIVGFRKEGSTLKRELGASGSRSELGFRNLHSAEVDSWEVPSNQVKVMVRGFDGSQERLSEGGTLDIIRDDSRLAEFHFGGLLPTRLTCGGQILGELSPERPVLSFYLSALESLHGRAGIIRAEALSGGFVSDAWNVLKWRTPQTALTCRVLNDLHVNEMGWLIKKVSLIGVNNLRLRIINVENYLNGQDAETFCDLQIPGTDQLDQPINFEPNQGFKCSLVRLPDDLANIRLILNRLERAGTLCVVDLECNTADSPQWQPVLCIEAGGRLALARVILKGIRDPERPDSGYTSLFWGDLENVPDLNNAPLEQWLNTIKWITGCRYPSHVWTANRRRLESLYPRLSAFVAARPEECRVVWWRHAVAEYQRHSTDAQSVVMPSLLLGSSLTMAASPLFGCTPDDFPEEGLVSRSFRESALYENRGTPNALNYLRAVWVQNRLDDSLWTQFSGFQMLLRSMDVPLGGLRFHYWCADLQRRSREETVPERDESFPLLTPKHFLACLVKLRRRADVFCAVANQGHGHWLGAHIAGLRTSRDRALQSVQSILGQRLAPAQPDIFLSPAENNEALGIHDDEDLIQDIVAATLLLALIIRARCANIITEQQMAAHLAALRGNVGPNDDTEGWARSQISLVLGTAPELFSFYYLLFTLAIAES
jgi:hypothetical protein